MNANSMRNFVGNPSILDKFNSFTKSNSMKNISTMPQSVIDAFRILPKGLTDKLYNSFMPTGNQGGMVNLSQNPGLNAENYNPANYNPANALGMAGNYLGSSAGGALKGIGSALINRGTSAGGYLGKAIGGLGSVVGSAFAGPFGPILGSLLGGGLGTLFNSFFNRGSLSAMEKAQQQLSSPEMATQNMNRALGSMRQRGIVGTPQTSSGVSTAMSDAYLRNLQGTAGTQANLAQVMAAIRGT